MNPETHLQSEHRHVGLKAGLYAGAGIVAASAAFVILPTVFHMNRADTGAAALLLAAFGCLAAGLFTWSTDRRHWLDRLQAMETAAAITALELAEQQRKIASLSSGFATENSRVRSGRRGSTETLLGCDSGRTAGVEGPRPQRSPRCVRRQHGQPRPHLGNDTVSAGVRSWCAAVDW